MSSCTSARGHIRESWQDIAPTWIAVARAGYDLYRDLVNSPAFFAALPPVTGLRCLDLGCGEGHNTRLLARRGAEVVALDIAEAFLRAAVDADDDTVRYVLGDGARLPFDTASFDVVTAFMSLMDVAAPEQTFIEIARVLRPGGFTQFSISHPATSTPIRQWVDNESGRRHALVIGEYFYEGELTERWTFGAAPPELRGSQRPFTITSARRTLAGWLNAVIGAGLTIEAIVEPHADEQAAATHPRVADTLIAPYFLLIRARRS